RGGHLLDGIEHRHFSAGQSGLALSNFRKFHASSLVRWAPPTLSWLLRLKRVGYAHLTIWWAMPTLLHGDVQRLVLAFGNNVDCAIFGARWRFDRDRAT